MHPKEWQIHDWIDNRGVTFSSSRGNIIERTMLLMRRMISSTNLNPIAWREKGRCMSSLSQKLRWTYVRNPNQWTVHGWSGRIFIFIHTFQEFLSFNHYVYLRNLLEQNLWIIDIALGLNHKMMDLKEKD